MDQRIAQSLSRFDTISLEDLNAKAAMLERLDNKYIVPADRLLPAFERFGDLFDVLEIGGKRGLHLRDRLFRRPCGAGLSRPPSGPPQTLQGAHPELCRCRVQLP